jgi:chaperonin cofactor prefoldin
MSAKTPMLFEDEEPQNRLQTLRRQRATLETRIGKVLDTLDELHESLRKVNSEILLLQNQQSLF